jgi:exopolyphosphatase/guanosine-5'-triphosphate,3'-diphosphate pyrophosphatase
MILSDANLPFRCDMRLMIALIARYHKKGTPSRSDKGYALLLSGEADRVDKLSAIIRVADGLDASHSNVVKSIKAKDEEDQVWLECQVDLDYTMEEDAIRKKKNLFKKIFKKPLKIEWKTA